VPLPPAHGADVAAAAVDTVVPLLVQEVQLVRVALQVTQLDPVHAVHKFDIEDCDAVVTLPLSPVVQLTQVIKLDVMVAFTQVAGTPAKVVIVAPPGKVPAVDAQAVPLRT
jgi:hypothetical protein